MSVLSFTLREPDRGRQRFRSREWWLSAHFPFFWRRSCSPGCRYGQEIQRGCERHYFDPHNLCESCWGVEGVTVDHYGHQEACRRQPKYLGHVAKGWWAVFPSWARWETQVMLALGGEDNMAQISLTVPILGRFCVGVKVPRAWTKPWVYERRELGFTLRGIWPTVHLGWDDTAKQMQNYYREPRKPDGYHPSRLSLVAGLKFEISPVRWMRLRNRLLGGYVNDETVLKVVDGVKVTLPEGDYPGTVTIFRERVKRPRWPRAIRDEVYAKFESQDWMPWPDKGENSYDCGDTGTKEHTVKIGPGRMSIYDLGDPDVAKVIGDTVAYVLRMRARYSRHDWQPEAVGVMKD